MKSTKQATKLVDHINTTSEIIKGNGNLIKILISGFSRILLPIFAEAEAGGAGV